MLKKQKNKEEKYKHQLGISYSTAVSRLQRRLLFSMIKKLGLDTCYRCGGRIGFIEDLSIDHKKEWLDNDTELFWNLDNIAFSHIYCNSVARRQGNQYMKTRGSRE